MRIVIQLVLFAVALVLAYLVYDGIQTKIIFREKAKFRDEVVIERLKEIREAQKGYKARHRRFARTFDQLIGFIQNDSLPIVKAIGTVPDSLTELEAVELGIVSRDTTLIAAIDTLFPGRNNIDSLRYIPFGEGQEFEMDAGIIEKNKVNVNVFEASAKLEYVYTGLDTRNENVDLEKIP